MDQFHQLLNQLNQNKPSTSNSTKQYQQKPIPPRQFPKRQYQKFTRKLWLIVTIVIMILILGGVVVGVHHSQTSHHVNRSSVEKTSRPEHQSKKRTHPAKPIRHSSARTLSPKQGEKLLGHWLIKLHYSSIQSQRILNIYQRSNVKEENSINQRLNNITNGNSTNIQKRTTVQNYLHQKFASLK